MVRGLKGHGGVPIDAGVGGVEGGAFRGSTRLHGFDAAGFAIHEILNLFAVSGIEEREVFEARNHIQRRLR